MANGRISGNLLLKVVIRESSLVMKYITSYIRSSLASLDIYMKSIKDNAPAFNTYVKNLLQSLSKRGETTHDLLINLAKGYKACTDKKFVKYIANVIERDNDDSASILNLNVLMVKAAKIHKSLM